MSPSWRDRLHIALAPERIVITRYTRGLRPRRIDTRTLTCIAATAGERAWQPALTALVSSLPELATRPSEATVVLSNHFVRYALVPGAAALDNDDERLALAQHTFRRSYGASADHWAVRVSDAGAGHAARPACAIDADLLDGLRALCAMQRVKLRGVRPAMMTSFNQWQTQLGARAWFALVEPGRACLAGFNEDGWHTIKTVRIDGLALTELHVMLERERILSAATGAGEAPAFLFAPGCALAVHEAAGWQLLVETDVDDTHGTAPAAAAAVG